LLSIGCSTRLCGLSSQNFYFFFDRDDPPHRAAVRRCSLSPAGEDQGRVQTGNIVHKTDRIHGLHFTARRRTDAVEGAKPDGTKNATR